MTLDWIALGVAVGVCLMVGTLEWFLTGDGLTVWYPRLKKPWWQLPLWLYISVGIAVYLLDGFVAYRILTAIPAVEGRIVAMTALVVVMVLNALWNYAFFEYRSTLIGLLGLIAFLGPLVILQVSLFAFYEVAAWAHMTYTVFVIGYDVPLFHAVWRLNPRPADSGTRT